MSSAGLVVLSPAHSHLGISTLVNGTAVLKMLYLFLVILNVAGNNVKCVNKFVPHPPKKSKNEKLLRISCQNSNATMPIL